MQLKSIFISQYKNLKNFTLDFKEENPIDIFVGKNGSGKSNILEAIIVIFRHIYEHGKGAAIEIFDYSICYTLDSQNVKIEWKENLFFLNEREKGQKSFSTIPLPENVLIYYSGHNDTITQLVRDYEERFRLRIKGASISESRRFIGIGAEYKSLLLCSLLMQPTTNSATNYVYQRLNIKSTLGDIILKLTRPKFATSRLKELGFESIDAFDTRSHYWGSDGITRTFLDKLITCVKAGFNHNDLYNSDNDAYSIPINIALFQKAFADDDICSQFRQFDNLKTLGMLNDISVGVTLKSDQPVTLEHFSDGQFQSIYIYAITELFKDRQCITLLDEPDSFLHPEWQFTFLEQIFEISETTAETNHILMSTHSASTIATADENSISLFEFEGGKVVTNKVKKSEIIKSLSAGLIAFTDGEARLNINNVLKNTKLPVLFTEGITDEVILETAWCKLYSDKKRPFEIQNAFDRIFLRNLFSREDLKNNFPNRTMFALFDFDEAYDDWNGLKAQTKGKLEESVPQKGLAKQLQYKFHYAMLLPVPESPTIMKQVLNSNGQPWGRGCDSYLSIELLFYREDWLGEWYKKRDMPGGGEIVDFTGDKVKFANEIVPTIDVKYFEIFIPLFDFILEKCRGKTDAA